MALAGRHAEVQIDLTTSTRRRKDRKSQTNLMVPSMGWRQLGHGSLRRRSAFAQDLQVRWPHGTKAASFGASRQTAQRRASSSSRRARASAASARAAWRACCALAPCLFQFPLEAVRARRGQRLGLERVEEPEGRPREVQLLRASREPHVEPRLRPTRRRVLGQLDGQLEPGLRTTEPANLRCRCTSTRDAFAPTRQAGRRARGTRRVGPGLRRLRRTVERVRLDRVHRGRDKAAARRRGRPRCRGRLDDRLRPARPPRRRREAPRERGVVLFLPAAVAVAARVPCSSRRRRRRRRSWTGAGVNSATAAGAGLSSASFGTSVAARYWYACSMPSLSGNSRSLAACV